MTRRYSAFGLFREGLRGHTGWQPAWRSPKPKPRYDVVIIGGGGHGLATAYYLAKNHGISNVAVIEKGWLGGGNTGRNTTIIRSNYFYPESVALYDFSLKLYEGLSRELNYNIMLSQRGVVTLCAFRRRDGNRRAHRQCHADQRHRRRASSGRTACSKSRRCSTAATARAFRSSAASGRAGPALPATTRSPGAMRAPPMQLGIDIIQNCEVTGFIVEGGRCVGVETTQARSAPTRSALAVAGHSGVLAAKAGFELPIRSYSLQAMVSEPVKPCLDTVVLSLGTGTYLSASRTRARSWSVAGSTAFRPMRSAAIRRCSRRSSPACWKCSRLSAS